MFKYCKNTEGITRQYEDVVFQTRIAMVSVMGFAEASLGASTEELGCTTGAVQAVTQSEIRNLKVKA